MKKHTISLLFLLLFGALINGISAQISGEAECVNFSYACGGAAAFFPAGELSVACSGNNLVYDIANPGNEICWSNYLGCDNRERSGCLNYKNWHFCSTGDGTVYQTLPRNSSINGITLGDYPSESTTDSSLACVGIIYPEFNNIIHVRTTIQRCQGDSMILRVPDIEFPDEYNGKLRVAIARASDNEVLVSNAFGGSDFNANNEINLTSMTQLLASGIYILELRLICDGQLEECQPNLPNRVKKTYIRIDDDDFSVQAQYDLIERFGTATDTIPPGNLSDTPDGVLVGYDTVNHANLSLSLYDISNAGGQGLTYQLFNKLCNTTDEWNLIGTSTISANDAISGTASLGNTNQQNLGVVQCMCYRLDITHFDLCTNGFSTVSKYYRLGYECAPTSVDQLNISSKAFELFPNPVTDHLNIEWNNNITGDINFVIYNAIGQIVGKQNVSLDGVKSHRIDLDLKPGAYHYSITWEQGSQAGTLIKR